jgi:excisionase family DNA binding protein
MSTRALRLARGDVGRRRRVPPAPTVDLWASPGPFFVAELATVLRCSPRYLEKLIRAGTLPASRLGRSLRIPASAARRLALEAGCEPTPMANQANQANGAHGDEPPRAGDGQPQSARRTV